MAEGTTFSDLVREAFIDPLRSVLIVDDQYPTWEEVLNYAGENKNPNTAPKLTAKKWKTNPEKPLRVIKQFRNRNPGFVIDIHDGLAPDTTTTLEKPETASQLADHLYQSDLLILDYNLEGFESGLGGEKARDILRSVLDNKHFNLIVIHTDDELKKVFCDTVFSLMSKCSSNFNEQVLKNLNELDEKLDLLLDAGEFTPEQLLDHLSTDEYLQFRESRTDFSSVQRLFMKSEGILARLASWADELELEGKHKRFFLFWAVREFENKHINLAENGLESLVWKFGDACIWLRTVRGFVAFVGKDIDNILEELERALKDWQPTPSRLLSAKYRHELSKAGIEAEDRTLLKTHVFAQFYYDISSIEQKGGSDEHSTRSRGVKLRDHVFRQSEAISFHIEDALVEFGEKIVAVDKSNQENFAQHYGVDLSDKEEKQKAVSHFNSYVSTLPLKKGVDQLDSGHIFTAEEKWWVCATPACDLQPGQNSIALVGQSPELRPFTALPLVKVEIADVSAAHINSGSYCFIETDSKEVICLGLKSLADDESPSNDKASWRLFLAKQDGLIRENKFNVVKLKLNNSAVEPSECEATVQAKLRYEYALNFIQKVGISVSRIGLGYVS